MEQLKMWWHRQIPAPVSLPDGFTVKRFCGSATQIRDWLDICKNGLLRENADEKYFKESMLGYKDLKPENIFFIYKGDSAAATVTAVKHEDTGNSPVGYVPPTGYVHMVACKPEYRGIGLGSQLNNIVMKQIYDWGCKGAYLTTDDFRIPAIKSYIRANFLPVLYQDDMRERWQKLLKEMNIPQIQTTDNDGNISETIKAFE